MKRDGRAEPDRKAGDRLAERRTRKKQEFLEEGKRRVSTLTMAAGAVVLTMLLVGAGWYVAVAGSGSQVERIAVSEGVDYSLENVEMTEIESEAVDGFLTFSLADVKKHKLVITYYTGRYAAEEYISKGKKRRDLPVLAYVTPKGKLVVAVSKCEPCLSEEFHTEPDGTLTCNACYTKWDLETLEGISGGCPNYPPEELEYEIEGDLVRVKERLLKNWQPRKV